MLHAALLYLVKGVLPILLFFSVKYCVDVEGTVKKEKVKVGLEFRRQGHLKQSKRILTFRSTKMLWER